MATRTGGRNPSRQPGQHAPLVRVRDRVGGKEGDELRVRRGHPGAAHARASGAALANAALEHLVERFVRELRSVGEGVRRAYLSCRTWETYLSGERGDGVEVALEHDERREHDHDEPAKLSTLVFKCWCVAQDARENAHGREREERQQRSERVARVVHHPRELELLERLGGRHRRRHRRRP